MVFSKPISIKSIKLFTLKIDNNQPSLTMGFDIQDIPDKPPKKWANSTFNACRIGLDCSELSDLIIKNIPTREILNITITRHDDVFKICARSENSLIEFSTKFPRLCGPSVYLTETAM
ncbi:Imm50 family immunity protein [Pseudomonas sp. NPDC087342]|uniref:Imm50 family immunity protein n=1 Tax=Pseudomonas sp. NPDC087342 TaxID=3364437 RepID=UPI003811872A